MGHFLQEAVTWVLNKSMKYKSLAHSWHPDNAADGAVGDYVVRSWWEASRGEARKGAAIPLLSMNLTPTKDVCWFDSPEGHVFVTFSLLKKINPAKACSLGCCVGNGHPCSHIFAACSKLGVHVSTLIHPANTTDCWIEQYSGVHPERLPNLIQDLPGHPHRGLALLPGSARSAGAPKKGRRILGLEDRLGSKKQKRQCYYCQRTDHISAKCPNKQTHLQGHSMPEEQAELMQPFAREGDQEREEARLERDQAPLYPEVEGNGMEM